MTRARRIAIFSLSPAVLWACSLSQNPGSSYVSLDLSSLNHGRTRLAALPDTAHVGHFTELSNLLTQSAPETIGGFSCFGINVTARDIPSTNAGFAANYSNDPDCTYPGVSSTLVPAQSAGASVELEVPFGMNRLIQVIGLQTTSSSCPSGLLTDHIFDSSVTGAYELGRAVGNVTTASSVAIKSRFTPDNLKKPFACPVMQMYAYVVNDGAPQDANTGRGSVQGIVQGFKVDKATGKLTQIPGATQATHGVIDSWSAIAVSHAGKWLYVYVDDYDGNPQAGPYTAQGYVDTYNNANFPGGGGCGGNFNGTAGRYFQDAEIDVYSIDAATGNLTPVQVVRVGEDKGYNCNYGAVAVDPYDQILFIGYGDNVAAYPINQSTGALSSSPQRLLGTSPSLSGFAIAPGGNGLYTPNLTNLSGYGIGTNLSSPLSALNPLNFSIDNNGSYPYEIAVDPEGKYLYSANVSGGAGISQFIANSDGTLTLQSGGPADPGISFPRVLVDPYYGVTLYGADATRDGVGAYPILASGKLGPVSQTAIVPNTTLVNTINDMQIDPWSGFIVAAYDSGHLVTFGLNRDGSFSGSVQLFTVTGASNPAALTIALVPQQ